MPSSELNHKGGVVIFLDADGVMMPTGGDAPKPSCLEHIKDIVAHCATEPTFVLSSSWRSESQKIDILQKAFNDLGGMPAFSGVTPLSVINSSNSGSGAVEVSYLKNHPEEQKIIRSRVDEIYSWLESNKGKYSFSEKRWIAIDDMDLGVDERMKNHFIKTDGKDGMTKEDGTNAKTLIDAFPQAPQSEGESNFPLNTSVEGVVKRYNATRGFGFLTSKTTPPVDIFVHQSAIKMTGFRGLNVGADVIFSAMHDGKKLQATEVTQNTPYIPHLNGANINSYLQAQEEAMASGGSPLPPPSGRGGINRRGGRGMGSRGGGGMRGGRAGGMAGGRGGASGNGTVPPPWMMPMIPNPDGSGWRAANGTIFYSLPANQQQATNGAQQQLVQVVASPQHPLPSLPNQ